MPNSSSPSCKDAGAGRGRRSAPSPPIADIHDLNHTKSPHKPAAAPNPKDPPPHPQTVALTAKISTLESQLHTLQADLSRTQAQLLSAKRTHPGPDTDTAEAAAEAIVRRHIRLLHAYNEIRDVGLGLMGLIADERGVRLAGVMEEFGVGGGGAEMG